MTRGRARRPCPARGQPTGRGPLPAKLEPLVETARAYARAATSRNTNRAYAADWRDYLRWRAGHDQGGGLVDETRGRRPLAHRRSR